MMGGLSRKVSSVNTSLIMCGLSRKVLSLNTNLVM